MQDHQFCEAFPERVTAVCASHKLGDYDFTARFSQTHPLLKVASQPSSL